MQAGKEGYFETAQGCHTCQVSMIWSGRHVVIMSTVTCQVQWNCCGAPQANSFFLMFPESTFDENHNRKFAEIKKGASAGLGKVFVFSKKASAFQLYQIMLYLCICLFITE